jgi:hypothetical protein
VTATAYDIIEQKVAEVGFEGFAEITPDDLVQESEEVPAVYGLIYRFSERDLRGGESRKSNWSTPTGVENERHWSVWGSERPPGRNSRPIQ